MKPSSGLRKLFRVRGGVHPDARKTLSEDRPIENLALPPLLHIPLQQHIGAAAEPLVRRGQLVRKGQLLARSQGMISAPVHSPTSGRIMGVGGYPAHHPSGLSVRTVTLHPDGHDEWDDDCTGVDDPFGLSPEAIAERVAAAGIVGMGGATFPSAVKLNLRQRYDLSTLVINGAECEPYLTCDDRLMRERPADVIDGVLLMAHALGVSQALIAVEDNKPRAQQALRAAAVGTLVRVVGLPARYPMGSEKHLVQALTGAETPARGLTADIGVVVHNVATAAAVHDALRHGRPLISRVVTVTGGAIRRPRNLHVAIGTPLDHLVEACGGFDGEPARLVSGGPMMGQPLPGTRVPVVKGSSSLLALSAAEVAHQTEMPCIRCGTCVRVCPCGLVPLDMAATIRGGSLEASVDLGLLDCVGCGSCAYACPSHIPLVQFFNFAKGELADRQRAQHKLGETRRLAEARSARMEAIKAAKRAAMAKRKRDLAAAKATASAEDAPRKAAAEAEA
jgi:electron transport complex protein RnfC